MKDHSTKGRRAGLQSQDADNAPADLFSAAYP